MAEPHKKGMQKLLEQLKKGQGDPAVLAAELERLLEKQAKQHTADKNKWSSKLETLRGASKKQLKDAQNALKVKDKIIKKQEDDLNKKDETIKKKEETIKELQGKNSFLEELIKSNVRALFEDYSVSGAELKVLNGASAKEMLQSMFSSVQKILLTDSKLKKHFFGSCFDALHNKQADSSAADGNKNSEKNGGGASQNSSGQPSGQGQGQAGDEEAAQRGRKHGIMVKLLRDVQAAADTCGEGSGSKLSQAVSAKNDFKGRDGIKSKKRRQSAGKQRRQGRTVKRELKIGGIPIDELVCPVCGTLTQEGFELLHKNITIVQSTVQPTENVLVEGQVPVRRCRTCGWTFAAPLENPPIVPGRQICVNDAAQLMTLRAFGGTIRAMTPIFYPNSNLGSSTIDDSLRDCGALLFNPIKLHFEQQLVGCRVLHADETYAMEYVDGKLVKRYFHQVCTPSYAAEQIIIFTGPVSRRKEDISSTVRKYMPQMMCTDCYTPYAHLTIIDKEGRESEITARQNCLAHLYNDISAALETFSGFFYKNKVESQLEPLLKEIMSGTCSLRSETVCCLLFLRCMNKLGDVFAVEQLAMQQAEEDTHADCGEAFEKRLFELRSSLRSSISLPLMNDIDVIMQELGEVYAEKKTVKWHQKPGVSCVIAEPVVYYLNNREGFRGFLNHAELDVDNMCCERAMRIVARFRDTARLIRDHESQDLAVMFSLIMTLTVNGVNDTAGYLADAAAWYSNNGSLAAQIEARRSWWKAGGWSSGQMKRINYLSYRQVYENLPFPEWLSINKWKTLTYEERQKLRCDVSAVLKLYSAGGSLLPQEEDKPG